MRFAQLTINLIATSLCTCAALGQSTNNFNAAAGGTIDFNSPLPWSIGEGPSSWASGVIVNGDIVFNTGAGPATINQIDSGFVGITGISTTGGQDVTLTGNGSFSFYNGNGTIKIEPSGNLTLDIDMSFNGDTEFEVGAGDTIAIQRIMAMSGSNAHLLIFGDGTVRFDNFSLLEMFGTIQVGYNDGVSDVAGNLTIENDQTLAFSNIALDIGLNGSVIFGTGTTQDETFDIWGLTGRGLLSTVGVFGENTTNVRLQGGRESEFNGYFQVAGRFTVTGEGTSLIFNPDTVPAGTISSMGGGLFVEDGGSFLMRSENQLAWLFGTDITINSGMFGGNGRVTLSGNPTEVLRFLAESDGGWLVGGDPVNGDGFLDLQGGSFTVDFNDNNGLWANVNPETVDGHGGYVRFNSFSTPLFFEGANLHVNVILDPDNPTYLATTSVITMLEYTGGLVPNNFIQYLGLSTFPEFDLSTNLVTRRVVVEDTWIPGTLFGASTDRINVRLEADYAAPAGGLAGLGSALNNLIIFADSDPTGQAGQLLARLETYANSTSNYQRALSWMLPTTEFVADRITADNMFFDNQRKNIRELAIGSRAPGMIKAREQRRKMLYASLQEEDSVATVQGQQQTRVIIETADEPTSDDVFQALYVDGYGGWDRMNAVSYLPGYSANSFGVEGGWGIALSDGITLGVSAGWEQTSATLNDNLGDIEVNSFRGAPFIAWSGVLPNNVEQYAILTAGGGYNYGHGNRRNIFGTNASVDLHGWEFDIEGSVGTRVPVTEVFAIQPEASLRYSIIHYSGTETDQGISTDYQGDDFQFINGRIGATFEWFLNGATRVSARVGYQGQYLDWKDASFQLPGGLGPVNQDGGSGTVNQVYTGLQLEFTPSWNTAITVGYDGAFGQGTQNAVSGGILIRF